MRTWEWKIVGGGYAVRIKRSDGVNIDLHDLALPEDETHEELASFIVSACNAAEQRKAASPRYYTTHNGGVIPFTPEEQRLRSLADTHKT